MLTTVDFKQRRDHLFKCMPENSVALLASGRELIRNQDSDYAFRVNSDFYYLTGFDEPETICVLIKSQGKNSYQLFLRPNDKAMEIWHGRRLGLGGAKQHLKVDEAFAIDEFAALLPEILRDKNCVLYAIGRDEFLEETINNSLNQLHNKLRAGVNAPCEIINIEKFIHEMRIYKSPAEIQLMRRSGEITAGAHIRAMQFCQPGQFEYQLEAELMHEFLQHGARFPAYNNIVASGENSCILHYTSNNRQIKNGDLVLIDAGCEYHYYAADVTRTFPANGKFSKEQQAIYEIVLHTQLSCIDSIKPGVARDKTQDLAIQLITQGLLDVGLLKGDVNDLMATQAYKQFYMHNIGHWLGMDVHDVGVYKFHNQWRKLEPNMVFTIEPGIYIAPAENVAEKWWNIGVRIEDDIVVTQTGCDVLTHAAPKTISDIEKAIQ